MFVFYNIYFEKRKRKRSIDKAKRQTEDIHKSKTKEKICIYIISLYELYCSKFKKEKEELLF